MYVVIYIFSAKLEKLANEIYDRIKQVEEAKYDLEYSVRQKDFEVGIK